jgi:hypothetical protein
MNCICAMNFESMCQSKYVHEYTRNVTRWVTCPLKISPWQDHLVIKVHWVDNEVWFMGKQCCNPTFGRVWGWHSHSQNGDLGVIGDSQNFRVRLQGQNTLPWGVLHVIGKLLKCRCRKWPRMSHLDIYNTSYGKKKGWESNWQFDLRPLKVGNRLDPGVCKWSVTHR